MFTQSDLTTLMGDEPETAVSIFMPTHVNGREVRQDAIRWKNLLAQAKEKLVAAGVADADSFLRSAADTLDDPDFWRQGGRGLAVFIDGRRTRHFSVPLELDEAVVVGGSFALRPLLPLVQGEGDYYVLTVTGAEARLRQGSRFSLGSESVTELPEHPLRGDVESDYENPVQASPANRPNVGSNISNAQVYGDSPAEFRKAQLLAYAAGIAKAVEERLASHPLPLVIVADTEVGGHLRQSAGLRRHLVGTVETNPASLDDGALHRAAYASVEQTFDRDRESALETAAAMIGRADERATKAVAEILEAAPQGRIDVLLLAEGGGTEPADADALEAAALQTVRNGGRVHTVDRSRLPDAAAAVALLRY